MKKSRTSLGVNVKRYLESELCWMLGVCLVAAGVLLFSPVESARDTGEQAQRSGMLFVGDVMLARRVDTLMDVHGTLYPFRGVRDLFAQYDVVVGNFEAAIPERYVHTPDLTFRFSVDEAVVPTLARIGVTDLTLANNHALDFGSEGHAHTKEVLTGAGIAAAGHPRTIAPDEVLYRTVDGVRVAVIPLNTTYGTPARADIETVLAAAAAQSDVQIVSVHWGTEYALAANSAQRALAHLLIDEGVDAIIGHHPHVVQNIEEYRGAPIFYSLGNFVFDQYWNSEVQQGLAVALSFHDQEVHYELIPISSEAQRSVPEVMGRVARTQFLDTLAERSEPGLATAIREARIVELFAPLASL